MTDTKYTITNQDRDTVFSTTDPESIKIQPKTRISSLSGNTYIAAINVYFSNILVASFESFTEAAVWLDNNITLNHFLNQQKF